MTPNDAFALAMSLVVLAIAFSIGLIVLDVVIERSVRRRRSLERDTCLYELLGELGQSAFPNARGHHVGR